MRKFSALLTLFLFVLPPHMAHAQVDSNFFPGGGLRIGYSTTTCDASILGALRYNSNSGGSVDFCNGSVWANVSSGSGSAAAPDRGIQFNSGGSFAASSSLVYSSVGKLGLGVSTPLDTFHLRGRLALEDDSQGASISFNTYYDGTNDRFLQNDPGYYIYANSTTNALVFAGAAPGAPGTIPSWKPVIELNPYDASLILPSDSGAGGSIAFNNRYDGGSDRYIGSEAAFMIFSERAADYLRISAAPIGTAGAAITWADALRVGNDASISFMSAARFTGDITSASLGASQNNYAPTGLAGASVIRLTASTPINITGLTGGSDGRLMVLTNVGANAITLVDQSGSSTAANRFLFGANLALAANQSATLIYDSTSSRWRQAVSPGSGGGGGSIDALSDGRTLYGSGSMYLGHEAPALTSGTYNTAIGTQALLSATSGGGNTAVGSLALDALTTANGNTAVGEGALGALTSNNYNTALGGLASTAVTGGENVALGFGALLNAVGANQNIAIGTLSAQNISTGNANIVIGYNVNPSSGTGNNQLNIGDTIYGDLSNDRIGIGQVPAAGVELDVLGDIHYTGSLIDVSDRRLKTDIAPLADSGSMLERIRNIDTYRFRMKADEEGHIEFGVMAQDLKEIFPELVVTNTSTPEGYMSVNYLGLIAPLIAAVQEQQALVEQQQAIIERQQAQIDWLMQHVGQPPAAAPSPGQPVTKH